MKIMNNDIKELDAWILDGFHTCGYNLKIDQLVEEGTQYLQEKYKTSLLGLDEYLSNRIDFLNEQTEQDYVELFKYIKKLFKKNFGDKDGLVFYIKFTFGLMEDGEHYSDIINGSKMINESLLVDYHQGFQYYRKDHKYEIGKPIYRVNRNLGKLIELGEYSNWYDFWENYKTE